MGLYGDKKDYGEIVKENIEKANLLYSLSEEDRKKVSSLLEQKEKTIEKNGFLANYQLIRINKKIEKIQKNSKNSTNN